MNVRDDNLRLIFAPVEQQLIEERTLDLRAGAMLLVIFCAATWLFTLGAAAADSFVPSEVTILGLTLVSVWLLAIGVSLLSPLIAIVLAVEYAKVRRRQREHDDLMRRYGRG